MSTNIYVLPPQAGGSLPANLAIPGLSALTHGTAATPVSSSGDTHVSNIAGWPAAETNDKSLVAYVIGWSIFLLIIALLNRTRAGHTVIYYFLVLALVLLLVVNYQKITDLVAPVVSGPGETGPGNGPTDTQGPSQENYNVTTLAPLKGGQVLQIQAGGVSAPRFTVM